MKKGLFITFEGPDGAGKTTQFSRLTAFLKERGLDVVVTREPGGTPIAEKIRTLLLDPDNHGMDSVTEALLYAASRAQHVAEVIKPALEAGRIVICDRFLDSSLAYQAYGRQLGADLILNINRPALHGVMPDLTLCILARPETSLRRLMNKGEALDRLEREKPDFFVRVYEGFRELHRQDPNRIMILDAEGSIEEIAQAVRKRIETLLTTEN